MSARAGAAQDAAPAHPAITAHSLLDDAQALLAGTVFAAVGLLFLRQAGLAVGGTAGLALLGTRLSDLPFGVLFFAIS